MWGTETNVWEKKKKRHKPDKIGYKKVCFRDGSMAKIPQDGLAADYLVLPSH